MKFGILLDHFPLASHVPTADHAEPVRSATRYQQLLAAGGSRATQRARWPSRRSSGRRGACWQSPARHRRRTRAVAAVGGCLGRQAPDFPAYPARAREHERAVVQQVEQPVVRQVASALVMTSGLAARPGASSSILPDRLAAHARRVQHPAPPSPAADCRRGRGMQAPRSSLGYVRGEGQPVRRQNFRDI